MRGGGGDRDEPAGPRRGGGEHGGNRAGGEVGDADDVDLEKGAQLLVRRLPQRLAAGDDARGRDRGVEPLMAVEDVGDDVGQGGRSRTSAVTACTAAPAGAPRTVSARSAAVARR